MDPFFFGPVLFISSEKMYARTHARYHKQTDGLTDGQRALADIDISSLFLSQTRILCPLSDSLLFAPLLKILLPSPDRDAVRMMRIQRAGTSLASFSFISRDLNISPARLRLRLMDISDSDRISSIEFRSESERTLNEGKKRG